MPGSIQKFFWIASASLFAGIAIGAAADLRLFADMLSIKQVFFIAIFQTAYCAIVFGLVWLAAQRAKNWARWFYLALTLYTLQWNIWPLGASEISPLGLLTLAQGLLKIISVGLLFTTASDSWFKHKTPNASA